MASVLTHPAIPIALSAIFPQGVVSPALLFAGAVCSVIPDADVITFELGIPYEDMLGHRGFTHSIVFAAGLGALVTFVLFCNSQAGPWLSFLFLFLSTLSHPLLDMLTNGGLGIALFAPFSNERYFFPWRPLEISPVGVAKFLSEWGLRVIITEIKWVWLPSLAVIASAQVLRRYR